MNKRNLAIALTCIVAIGTLASCNKYEDGPGISLRSRRERVANTWQVENYKVNGSDLTSLVADYTETFTKDYDYSYQWGSLDGTGTWVFQNNDEEINLTGTDDQTSRILEIEKLEEKAFWYYYMDGDDKHEIHLIPN
ncbi:MAG: hypothetical protein ACKVOR_02415 [Flavobacteriales bacterium]